MKLLHGDCLELMKEIPDGSIDMILCDLPYGTIKMNLKWDTPIHLDLLWEQYERIIKPRNTIALFSSQPFTTHLIMSKLDHFKYEWIWKKSMKGGCFDAKIRPMKEHEVILIFSKGGASMNSNNRMLYHPQGMREIHKNCKSDKTMRANYRGTFPSVKENYLQTQTGYPTTILDFPNETGLHPTQKPVLLLEYLIRTYTNEGDTVLDNCMGSGSTGVACLNTNRNFIGMEKDEAYWNVAVNRIATHKDTFML